MPSFQFLIHGALLILIVSLQAINVWATDSVLRDPTQPSGSSVNAGVHTGESGALELTFIRLGAEPLAVINGKNLAPGESIAGYRLLSLQLTSATLAGPNGHVVLQLTSKIRKSPSTISVQNHSS